MAFSKFYHQPILFLLSFLLVQCLCEEDIQKSPNEDLIIASSIAVKSFKMQTTAARQSANKYGYPYLIAPTLTPIINSRADDDEDANEAVAPVALVKPYGSKLSAIEESAEKKTLKKLKPTYNANRRSSHVTDAEYPKRYKEPKYRNFDQLESKFMPRRIDLDIPYSEYYRPKARPQVSPRDPYLSSPKKSVDSFYPIPKTRSYPAPYKQSGRSHSHYGAGRYEMPQPSYYDEPPYGGYTGNGYDTPTKYPDDDEPYNYQEDYTIESNKPITGDIRKRLLDYAGAADLYEGEPDYLRQVALNKHKYGQIGNDYYAYGGPEYKKSYRDFPYVESKISLVKKSRL